MIMTETSNYASYLSTLLDAEGKFEPVEINMINSDITYSVQHVAFVLDCSGSTLNRGRGRRNCAESVSDMPSLYEKELVSFPSLTKEEFAKKHFSRACSEKDILDVLNDTSTETITPEVHVRKTKHISLAMVESMSAMLSILAKTLPEVGTRVSIIQFDDTAIMAYDSKTAIQSEILQKLAESLPDVLLSPRGGGTSLSAGLSLVDFCQQNTLLVILTDGQCSDSDKVDEIMAKHIETADKNGKRIDIFIVGAGSIGITNVQTSTALSDNTNSTDEGMQINLPKTPLVPYAVRTSMYSHMHGSSPTFAGTECNRAYLMKLANFHTILGRSAYAGAYRDYQVFIKQFIAFVRGDLDNTKFVYVSGDKQDVWWPAKEHQYKIANVAFADPTLIEYDMNGFKVSIGKRDKNIVEVTDEYGTTRTYMITDGRMKQ